MPLKNGKNISLSRNRTSHPRERGFIAIIIAVMIVPIMLACGLAIDTIQIYSARQALGQAVDAATVAAAADNFNTSSGSATSIVQAFLAVNAPTAQVKVVGSTVTSNSTTRTVSVTVNAMIATNFMKLLGVPQVNMTVGTNAERAQPGPLDLVLALDTTASMNLFPAGGSEMKITTLIDAATALVSQVMVAGNTQIKVGLAPYSSYMNVGLISPTPDWVVPRSRTSNSCLRREFTGNDCKRTRIDCWIDGIWTPQGCSNVDCGACLETQTIVHTWTGCIAPRTLDGSSTGTDIYLDTIAAPTSPRYPGIPSDYVICSSLSPILPLTSDRTSVLNQLKTLKVSGETYIPSGLTWGWNLLAPAEPYPARTLAELQAIGGKKVLVLMTDGVNSLSPRLIDAGLLPNGNVSIPAAWRDGSKSNALISTLCTKIKADGIEIYTVLFDVSDAATQQRLRDCATSPNYAYQASDKAGLLRAFADISDRLKRLRLLN